MNIRLIKNLIAGVVLVLVTASSHAAVVTIESLVATWENISPATGISVFGNGTTAAGMLWGSGPNGPAGYSFLTAGVPITNVVPPDSPVFSLGTFTHANNPITGTSLTSATLRLTAEIAVDAEIQGLFNFLFDFTHQETPNAGACPNGIPNGVGVNINGCADIVDLAFSTLSDSFLVDGTLFTLNIVPGSTHFETIESAINQFDIGANIVARSTIVPEPATIVLFGLGLLGLGFQRSRRLQA